MLFNFKKNAVVGVSVSPENGLEMAQIDFGAKKIVKYSSAKLAYDNVRKEIADLDIFKETLLGMLTELDIPKGSDIVISLPAILFKINDYPASLSMEEIAIALEEDSLTNSIFQNIDPCISFAKLPNSTMQTSKVGYIAAQKSIISEIAMQVQELGYNLVAVDSSVNSTLNALIYNDRVNTSPNANWVLLMVENNCCRIISMQGANYVDYAEEKISIGDVLGDAENYETVVNAVNPLLKNLPSQCLYVVSKTNTISAKVLSGKLSYGSNIIYQEANIYNTEPYLDVAADVDDEHAKNISLDVIGAAIYRNISQYMPVNFNMFNESLGDIYTQSQPPVLYLGSRKIVMSLENMLSYGVMIAIALIIVTAFAFTLYSADNAKKQKTIDDYSRQIAEIDEFLNLHKDISSEVFDEGEEIGNGVTVNKNVYNYYRIVGTEIPKKLWLTSLELGKNTTIRGQADNIESIYGFFRNIKDYNPSSGIKLQKLGLATSGGKQRVSDFDTDSIITSMNADYYEFVISDAPEKAENDNAGGNSSNVSEGLEPLE